MILLTGRDTGLPAFVDEHDIVSIDTVKGKPCPFSRIHLRDSKQNHDFFLDVTENSVEIKQRIKHKKLDLGCEARGYTND